ncbi:unnamed protein product [Bemisia tabaci]|uniref:Uncharacterized protein n=1 Tax=Bemisia tabaci TaxID=7038 RepID=A0A9P0A7W6_BEMTA|nr:unnamed protein product [Bemisia tabaci]
MESVGLYKSAHIRTKSINRFCVSDLLTATIHSQPKTTMKFQVTFVFAVVAVFSVFGQESAEQVRDKRAIFFSDAAYGYAPAAYAPAAYAPAAYATYAAAPAAYVAAAPAAYVAAAPAAVPVAAPHTKVVHSAPGSYAEYHSFA